MITTTPTWRSRGSHAVENEWPHHFTSEIALLTFKFEKYASVSEPIQTAIWP